MQDNINLYITRDRLNNASFRQKLDLIAKIDLIALCLKAFQLLVRKIQLLDCC